MSFEFPDSHHATDRNRFRQATLTQAEELALVAVVKADPSGPAARDALGQLYARHRGLMVQWSRAMVLGGFDLDDMISECFFALRDACKWFKPELGYAFNTYLKRCALNRLAKWRQDERQQPLPQEGADESLDLEPAPEPRDLEGFADLLAALTPLERQVLELKYGLAGGGVLTDADVARRLGISRETAEWVGWEARLKIKRRAEDQDAPLAA